MATSLSALQLHQAAKIEAGMLVDHLAIKTTNYLIAVQWHDAERLVLKHQDFMWVKGNAKVGVGKVKEAYLGQDSSVRQIALKIGPYTPSDVTKMTALDHFGDRIVVFKAEPADEAPGFASEPPYPLDARPTTTESSIPAQSQLQVSGYKTPSNVSHAPIATSPDVRHMSRTPLQPTNTQVRATPNGNTAYSPGSALDAAHVKPEYPLFSQYPMGQQSSHGIGRHNDENRPSSLPTFHTAPLGTRPEVALPQPIAIQPFVKPESVQNAGDTAEDIEHQDDNDGSLTNIYLQELTTKTAPEKLEQGVQIGLQLLEHLKQSLIPALNTDDGRDWLAQIEAVKSQASRARTVVGVVGNTGSGKSSCINSLLDYERLVPTNCMRACTAVVTEMSYNDSDDVASSFRAEIEFIKPEEWERELKVLFDEVIDSSGNISREVYNSDSEAGIAYAKIRAVYYKHTKEEFAASSVDKLMQERHVQNVLGETRDIKERDCDKFYRSLQYYVDSKEKAESTAKMTEEEKKSRKREMEFWPLIKVVRIYVKADALSTGAVIVDLPGVHDSNAARAAVAEGYMKQCTGLWIVAPITRAVDDKAAKNLLGETFRRQLKYDGTYSAVTFICSKTDDISNTEATDSLGLADRMTLLDDELYEIDTKRRQLKKELEKLKTEKAECRKTMDDADEQQDAWDKLDEELADGHTIYAPMTKTKKRKRSTSSGSSDDDDDDYEVRPPAAHGPPLTEVDIGQKLNELKSARKEARRRRSEVESQIKEVNLEIKDLTTKSDAIESKRSAICIAGRNKYSRSAIQVDFAAGIKELDQENQAEEDEDNFDPEEDLRDYEKVAASLPVFCVSSRAYQKLSGRLVKDHAVKGFTHVDETEIPALQRHAKKLTEGARTASCRRFLNSLAQLRISMNLWASNDGTGAKLSDTQRDTEQKSLTRKLKELEKSLETCVDDTLNDMKDTMQENIFENFDDAVKLAVDAALPTSSGWGAHRSMGGMYWSTYKATVRRQGAYSGASGKRDFNSELSEPLYKHLATGWEKAFQRRLPHVLKACAAAFCRTLNSFHKEVEQRARAEGGTNPRLGMLAHQLKAYEAVFTDLANRMVESINERQREANREFTPTVCRAMDHAYQLTTDERGSGSYARMKDHMATEVGRNKDVMFKQATDAVKAQLTDMCKTVERSMEERTDEIYVCMRRDYYAVLGNGNVDAGQMMPKWERTMRDEIEKLIVDSEENFKGVIDGQAQSQEGASADGPDGSATFDAEQVAAAGADDHNDAGRASAGAQDNDTMDVDFA